MCREWLDELGVVAVVVLVAVVVEVAAAVAQRYERQWCGACGSR